ncbi:hypothetical protein ACRS2S_19945 [Achromobacter xylosoxidans]|uniref:hypothetical protein n=1 Tax=Alcaligenes xylosoxydans xylosoxydans TaxID=85698 RepID=UPI003EE1CDBE
MTNQDSAPRAPNKEIREAFELSYAADADDPASATELSHFTNGWRACVMSTTRGPVAREAPPAAFLTLDEGGSPCMLFFDVVEARSYCVLGEEPEPLYRCPAPAACDALTAAARDVLAERQRQVSAEGWTPEQDDRYTHGDMASAAACYANQGRYHFPEPGKPGPNWPWAAEWWKPSTYRRNLEKAGALILAEIERLDRAAAITAHKRDE